MVGNSSDGHAQTAFGTGTRVVLYHGPGRTRGRHGTVLGVRACEGVSQGTVIVVRWDDDGSFSWVVPGADLRAQEAGGAGGPATAPVHDARRHGAV